MKIAKSSILIVLSITLSSITIKGECRINTQHLNLDFTIKNQPDTIIPQLQNINLSQFDGQPVDSLLAHLPSGVINMRIGTWRSQKLAEVLYVSYPNNVFVEIHVRNFQHMNPKLVNTGNPTQNWDINLFKQELITYSIAFNHRQCINGCQHINK